MSKQLAVLHAKSKSVTPSENYLLALRFFWQGETAAAISLIADQLGEDQFPSNDVFYRLWIEILAEQHDDKSLRILQQHIQRQIDYKHPSWIPRLALVGLIHCEMGEREAAVMLVKRLKRHLSNPYCKELDITISLNTSEASTKQQLKNWLKNSGDYFHYRRAALAANSAQHHEFLAMILKDMKQTFSGCPFALELEYHNSFSRNSYRKASLIARVLRSRYPTNTQFQLYFAFSTFLAGRSHVALSELKSLSRKLDNQDPDILCLIGKIILEKQLGNAPENIVRQASYYLERARERYEGMGLSAAYPNEILSRLREDDAHPSGKFWLVSLPARQSYELHRRPLERISYLNRAMGEQVRKGDICFMISESPFQTDKGEYNIRLLALYKCIADPEWHPAYRQQTLLKLQMRMEHGIPVTLSHDSLHHEAKHSSSRYGVFEIHHNELKAIEDSIASYMLDDETCSHLFHEWRRQSS